MTWPHLVKVNRLRFLFSRQELVAPSQGAVLETESGASLDGSKRVKTALKRVHSLFKAGVVMECN